MASRGRIAAPCANAPWTRNERPGGRGARLSWSVGGGASRLLAGGAALPAGALEHLLVLLLAHALAALLDQRTHPAMLPRALVCALMLVSALQRTRMARRRSGRQPPPYMCTGCEGRAAQPDRGRRNLMGWSRPSKAAAVARHGLSAPRGRRRTARRRSGSCRWPGR